MPRWLGWRVSARSNMDRKPLRGNFSPKRRAVVAKNATDGFQSNVQKMHIALKRQTRSWNFARIVGGN
jgi:hypothetical protein